MEKAIVGVCIWNRQQGFFPLQWMICRVLEESEDGCYLLFKPLCCGQKHRVCFPFFVNIRILKCSLYVIVEHSANVYGLDGSFWHLFSSPSSACQTKVLCRTLGVSKEGHIKRTADHDCGIPTVTCSLAPAFSATFLANAHERTPHTPQMKRVICNHDMHTLIVFSFLLEYICTDLNLICFLILTQCPLNRIDVTITLLDTLERGLNAPICQQTALLPHISFPHFFPTHSSLAKVILAVELTLNCIKRNGVEIATPSQFACHLLSEGCFPTARTATHSQQDNGYGHCK